MRFEWDTAKDAANQRNHYLSFETARRVFDDRLALSYPERVVEGEQRWQTIGKVGDLALILVAHSLSEAQNEEVIRIISARKATRHERKQDEQA